MLKIKFTLAHTRYCGCAELVHKSYDVHATCASRSVRSQGVNLVQIVSSFNLHFSSADSTKYRYQGCG